MRFDTLFDFAFKFNSYTLQETKEDDRLKKMEAMINSLTEQQKHLINSLNVTNK